MPKSKTCKECGGTRLGRGFAHALGCSLARGSQNRGKRGRRRMGRSNSDGAGHDGNGFGLDLRRLKGMSVETLAGLRGKIDAVMKGKAPALKEKIKTLQATLASIR